MADRKPRERKTFADRIKAVTEQRDRAQAEADKFEQRRKDMINEEQARLENQRAELEQASQ
jgi:hypothetical protein